jgi:hypothetical protein
MIESRSASNVGIQRFSVKHELFIVHANYLTGVYDSESSEYREVECQLATKNTYLGEKENRMRAMNRHLCCILILLSLFHESHCKTGQAIPTS